jgi:hypothetical protein
MKRLLVAALAGAAVAALGLAPAARVDAGPPTGQVESGFHSPVQGSLDLYVSGHAVGGATLANAAILLNGNTVARSALCPAGQACTDSAPGGVQVSLDTTPFADGVYDLEVTVTDSTGAASTVYEFASFEIWNHRPTSSPSATLTVGSGVPAPQGSGGSGGTGGVAGATASSCSRPRLSVVLDQKPLRIRHGVPVLKRGKRYRFRGRLTCVVHHKRVSAPKRTRIDRLDKVGRRMVHKGGALVRGRGRITFIVPALSSRTLIFRFINGGRRVDVKIKIKVARR